VTVVEVIQRSTEYLQQKGVESPRLQSELLLAHVLKLPRLRLYLSFDRALLPDELQATRDLVMRRGRREPLQHLLGSVSFCGLELSVTPAVLIPRPETELLAEQAAQFLIARSPTPEPPSMLDFGTGSGCLAIAVAAQCPAARVTALDISEAALAVARENSNRHRLTERVQFFCGDAFAALPAEMRFDLIVANPPYIPSAVIATLEPEVRDHDPRIALDGGADGLDTYRRLACEAGAFLRPDGRMMLEIGDDQGEPLRNLFSAASWETLSLGADYSGRPRMLTVKPGATL
jgi:release factor glutamine methyltransferase